MTPEERRTLERNNLASWKGTPMVMPPLREGKGKGLDTWTEPRIK